MSAMSLETADLMHEYSRILTVRYHKVDHELFHQFCKMHRQLLRDLDESAQADHWVNFLAILRRYRIPLSAAPLPFNHPDIAPAMNEPELRAFVARTARAYPSFAETTRKVADFLIELRRSADNPLLDALESLAGRDGGSTVVLVRQSRLIAAVRDALRSRAETRDFDAIGIGALGAAIYDRVILVGSTRWYPSHVLTAPSAPVVEVVSYRWNRSRWRPERAFLGSPESPSARDYEPSEPEEEDVELDDTWPEIDWDRIAQRAAAAGGENDDAEGQELVEARLFSLEGGSAVFLHAAEGAKSLVIDPRADGNSRVKRIETDEIEPGVFVLLRTEGGGDYIVPVANWILRDRADESRESQRQWKRLLRDQVMRKGALQVSLELIDLGSNRADEANVRNWMSERNIATQDKNDFAAIMWLVGLGAEIERRWEITRLIRAAHLRAGRIIGNRLLDQVGTASIYDLEREGRMDFALPEEEGGRLTAFRVEGRALRPTWVPASQVDVEFPLEVEA